jgi:hypothetical protein
MAELRRYFSEWTVLHARAVLADDGPRKERADAMDALRAHEEAGVWLRAESRRRGLL